MGVFFAIRLRHAAALIGSGGLAAGMILAVPGVASATMLTCGSTIGSSGTVTLTANVDCTSDDTDNGITIEASDVTLNLNGYKILGPGASDGTSGVYDSGNSGLTVENGTISNFGYDANIDGASGSDLTGIVVQHVTTTNAADSDANGIYGTYLDGASIQHVSISNAGAGVALSGGQDSTVAHSTLTAPTDCGLSDIAENSDDWSDNTVITPAEDAGALCLEEDTAQVVTGNTVTGGPGYSYGIEIDGTQAATVSGNTLNYLYLGVDGADNTGSTFSDNKGTGDDWGIYDDETTGETYTGNNFSDGSVGIETDYSVGATLRNNTTDGNSEDGVFIYSGGESGYSATLTSNTGNDNRYGLYSQFPTSGHSNHAAGNAVVNCHNVHCEKAKATRSAATPPHLRPYLPAVAIAAPGAWTRRP